MIYQADPVEALIALIKNIEKGNFDAVDSMLDDHFSFSGHTLDPMDRESFITLNKALVTGFSDFSFNLKNPHQTDGVKAGGMIQISGKHTGVLDLSVVDLPIIQPTHKAVLLPEENIELWIEHSKVIKLIHDTPDEGGFYAMFQQLGVEMTYEQE